MDTDGALVIDLRKPGWADDAPALIAGLTTAPPAAVTVALDGAPPPSAPEAQLLMALTRHAAAAEIPVTLSGDAADVTAELRRLGLADALPGQGDNAE